MIGIKGVRLVKLEIDLMDKTGSHKPSGKYEILSTADRVLAKQDIGGYGGIEIPASVETTRLLNQFVASYNRDISTVCGLDEAAQAATVAA